MTVRHICSNATNLIKWPFQTSAKNIIKWPFQSGRNFLATTASATAGAVAVYTSKQFIKSPYHLAILTGLAAALTLANRVLSSRNQIKSKPIIKLPEVVGQADALPQTKVVGQADALPQTKVVGQADALPQTKVVGQADALPQTEVVGQADALPQTNLLQQARLIKDMLSNDKQTFQETYFHRRRRDQKLILRPEYTTALAHINVSVKDFQEFWDLNPNSYENRYKAFMKKLPKEFHKYFIDKQVRNI